MLAAVEGLEAGRSGKLELFWGKKPDVQVLHIIFILKKCVIFFISFV